MKILYFDCFSGAAGDMLLGACLDAGLPLNELKRALGSLGVEGWDISADRVVKAGVSAAKFRVHLHSHTEAAHNRERAHVHSHTHSHVHRHHAGGREPHARDDHHAHPTLAQIRAAIDQSALSAEGRRRANVLFDRLGEAEAAIHDTTMDQVHLHEVGALDSIIDIVGVVFALEWFAADRIAASPINVGGGMVRTAHGLYPVPAPATMRLLGKAPIYGRDVRAELLTPTGALLLSEYVDEFGPLPPMRVERVGYGAGDLDLADTPNVVRLVVGEGSAAVSSMRVSVVECEIDDMNPQLFGSLMERLYAAGALDVFYSAVQMKKNRPGTLVTIIARPRDRAAVTEVMFKESTTIGVRYCEMDRECLDRDTRTIETPLGAIRFKVARRGERVLNAQPEFDDVARVAADRGVPIKEAQAIAIKAWLDNA